MHTANPNRVLYGKSWLIQARRSLRTADGIRSMGDHAWACFTYQQAAEMALKAGLEEAQRDHTGHYLPGLLTELCLARGVECEEQLSSAARRLTRLYIPTRYPDAVGGGVPADSYGAEDSEQAHIDASAILEFVSPRGTEDG